MTAAASAPTIALTTFSRAALGHYTGTNVDELLAKVDREGGAWVHLVRPDATVTAAILAHFGLPPALAEQLGNASALELDTSSNRYLLKKFRFIEEAHVTGTPPSDANVLIRGSETDRLVEGGGSIVVGERLVLLVEDRAASPLVAKAIDSVLHRERELRERGIEYLLYRLTKTLFVDNYSGLMRKLIYRLQELEPTLLEGSTEAEIYREVTRLRRELHPFERSLGHMAEFIAELGAESPTLQDGFGHLTGSLRADCDTLERELSLLRERTSELIDTYRDNVDRQLNTTMRTLTVLSALFLPLSFVTSFYGMNFTNTPALEWRSWFPLALAAMLALLAGSLGYARRKKWL